ncbi:hypothetical protein [Tritonibacter mobilis]|uniref:hypothetical protein n=1 Tax=Tritonibacter mobilis TaxID=379347 RepID=UPI0008069DD3|nr:hypothetical protein [Tritonibacter mobilis]
MSRHSFDPAIAAKTSIAAAVIYQNIAFWCEKNEANGRHLHDGKTWSYNSITAFEKLFPYLTKSQIRTALDKLEEAGFIEVGVFNQDPRDKTKWYAISRTCICEKSQMELSEIADPFAKNRKPLPDIKPDIKQTPKPPEGDDDLFSADNPTAEDAEAVKAKNRLQNEIDQGFAEFWKQIWPNHFRKTGKADCLKVYTQACTGKHAKAQKISPQALNAATRAYIRSVSDQQYLKGPLPWLRQPGWEPFVQDGEQSYRWDDLTQSQRNQLQSGNCPRSMLENGEPNAVAAHWLAKMRRAS